MILKLKNGTQIKLAWNYLVIEELENREGSLSEIQKKINSKQELASVRLANSFVYAVIQAALDDEVLTYKQTIRLVNPSDYAKILNFIEQKLKEQDSFKQKKTSKKNGNRNQGKVKN